MSESLDSRLKWATAAVAASLTAYAGYSLYKVSLLQFFLKVPPETIRPNKQTTKKTYLRNHANEVRCEK